MRCELVCLLDGEDVWDRFLGCCKQEQRKRSGESEIRMKRSEMGEMG